MTNTNKWLMWAYLYEDGRLAHIGSRKFVEHHFIKLPIVPVIVEEDEAGTFFGWIDKDEDSPCMIWGTEIQFKMCFAYGPQASIDAGHGRAVKLTVVQDMDRAE